MSERDDNPLELVDDLMDYLFELTERYQEGNPIVPGAAVQDHLDKMQPFTSPLPGKARSAGFDPDLIDIIERFLDLTDERSEDGSVEHRMLCYHTRVAYRLRDLLQADRHDQIHDPLLAFIALNFNKPSVVQYYQQKVPVWVALGEMDNPHIEQPASSEKKAFNPLFTAMESMRQSVIPGGAKAYDEDAASLEDQIKEAVEP